MSDRKKILRGKARMKEQGYLLSEVWFDKAEMDIIRKHLDVTGKPLATFVRECAVATATDAQTGAKQHRKRQNSEE